MRYLRRLWSSELGQASAKSVLVMSCFWAILFGIHAVISLLFLNFEIFSYLFLASIAWGTYVNYTWGWSVDETEAGIDFASIFKSKNKEKGEE